MAGALWRGAGAGIGDHLPGHEFADAIDGMAIGDFRQDIAQVGFRVQFVEGVVQNRLFLGYMGERKRPGFEARFRLRSWPVREAISLPRSSALRLNGSKAQQRQPVRMTLAGHQFPWALAGTLGNPATHEAMMVQEAHLIRTNYMIFTCTPRNPVVKSVH